MRQLLARARRAATPALVMVAMAAGMALPIVFAVPSSAQFMDGRFPFMDFRRRSAPWGAPWQRPRYQEPRQVDATKAPAARKPEQAPTMNVVVMGDSMADWLAFGLEDALSETPEIGVTRKHRTVSSLIKGEQKEAYDWPQQAREILAHEKANFVVMMLGLSDRQPIRERPRVPPKPAAAAGQPAQGGTPAQSGQPATAQSAKQPALPPVQPLAGEGPPDSGEKSAETKPQETPPAAPEAPAGPSVTHEFRSERWGEIYSKRIDDTLAALKSKGVPVFWVGLPPIRGARATADIAFLNNFYRGRAEKAGVVYVDVWDGFLDESGVFNVHGPDFEGQTRRLRTADGVHFTKAGARKLAHYLEREIRRVMQARGAPMAMPAPEEPQPQVQPAVAAPRQGPPPRPVAGPVVPLVLSNNAPEGLLGGGPVRPAATDPVASRVLVRGEPVAAPSGRADDFAWPRRDGLPTAGSTPPGAAAEPAVEPLTTAAPAAGKEPAKPDAEAPPRRQRRAAPRQQQPRSAGPFGLFGGGGGGPRPPGMIPW